jgi:hypothetical protein
LNIQDFDSFGNHKQSSKILNTFSGKSSQNNIAIGNRSSSRKRLDLKFANY